MPRDVSRLIFSQALSRGFALALQVVSVAILNHALGPEGRGVLGILIFINALFYLFGTFGINYTAVSIFDASQKEKICTATLLSSLAIGFGTTILGVLLVFAAPSMFPGGDSRLHVLNLCAVPFQVLFINLQALMIILVHPVLVGISFLFPFLVTLVGFLVLSYLGKLSLLGVMWTNACAYPLASAFCIWTLFKYLTPIRTLDLGFTCRRLLSQGLLFTVVAIVNFLATRIDVYILFNLGGDYQAGLYSFTISVVGAMLIVGQSFQMGAMRKLSDISRTEELSSFSKYLGVVFWCSLGGGLTVYLARKPLILILGGVSFLDARHVFPLLIIWALGTNLQMVLSAIITRLGRPIGQIIPSLIGLFFSVCGNFLLVSRYGAIGSGSVAAIQAVLILFAELFILKSFFNVKISIKESFSIRPTFELVTAGLRSAKRYLRF
jgi:O-antigen/teichoic acid export membrane protein